MRYIIFAILLFAFCACDIISDLPLNSNEPEFRIVTRLKGVTDTGRPKVDIIIKNIGDATGYNVSCNIQAKRGNTIVGSAFAYFGGGGDIDPGERAKDQAIFWGLSSITDCSLAYELSWLER